LAARRKYETSWEKKKNAAFPALLSGTGDHGGFSGFSEVSFSGIA
jgi:hypothetical protein